MSSKKLSSGSKALYLLLATFLACLLCFSVFAEELIPDPNAPERRDNIFPDTDRLPEQDGIDYYYESGQGGGRPIEDMMGRAVNLPPMYPENIPIDEMVMGKLGDIVMEKYSFGELVSMCPNEDAILEKVMAVVDEEELKRACEPLEEDLARCEEAKDFCSEMEFGPMRAPMPFPSDKDDDFRINCPPEMDELVQLCLEKTKDQERKFYEENKEFMGLDCEIEWERNVYHFERQCEDYKREIEERTKWENCPPKDELHRKDQDCKAGGRIAEWYQDDQGCPYVECTDSCPSHEDLERQRENCQRMGMGFREEPGRNNCTEIKCESSQDDSDWDDTPPSDNCPSDSELEEEKRRCNEQGLGWNEFSNKGCRYIGCYAETGGPACLDNEHLSDKESSCTESGGTPHRQTDTAGCEYINCEYEPDTEPQPTPTPESTPCEPATCDQSRWKCGTGTESTCNTVIDCGSCPAEHNCEGHQCIAWPEPTPESTPEDKEEGPQAEAQQDLSKIVMPGLFAVISELAGGEGEKMPGPNDMGPKDMGPNNIGPRDGGPGGYGPSFRDDRSIFCDKDRFIRECTIEREEKITKEFETRNYERICELEMKRSIRHLERFCEEKGSGKEECLKHAERGCSVIEKTIEKCNQIADEGKFEEMIKRKVHEMCRFSDYKIRVQVKSLDDFDPSEILPVIVSTSDDITPEQEEILRRFGRVHGFNSISGIRVYSMSVSAAKVHEIRALQFVDEVKLDHLARALEAQQKKIGERPQMEQKIIKTISVLDAAESEVSDQYRDMVSAGKIGLVDVSDGIEELDESEKDKGAVYHLTKFIGLQAEREIEDAEKLAKQVEKLKATITLLSAIAEDIEDPIVKANLLNMIKDLETQVDEMTASIEAKKSGAGGLPGAIGSLFGGGE